MVEREQSLCGRGSSFAGIVLLALVLALGACAGTYQPYLVKPKGGLPTDAFARCVSLLQARYSRLHVADEAAFRLQTEWVAGPNADKASQQRATLFLQDGGVACVVEVRFLDFGLFASIPEWTPARSDRWLEDELGEAVGQALAAG